MLVERLKPSPDPVNGRKGVRLCLANHAAEVAFGWSRMGHKTKVAFHRIRRPTWVKLGLNGSPLPLEILR